MVDGSPAVSAATCTFTGPQGQTELVTLNAKPTLLQCDGVGVLVNGDSVTSPAGNTIKVSSTRSLLTT
jgi:hypothetical protein